jgi:hypothetical protein
MADQDTKPTFAILRTDESPFDVTEISRLLAKPLQYPVADVVRILSQSFGILAERLSEEVAGECVSLLDKAGLKAQVVPQSVILDLPELIVLRSCRPDEDVLVYSGSKQNGTVPWGNVLWIDLVSVQEVSTEQHDDLEYPEGGGDVSGARVRRVKTSRLVTKYPFFIDLVISEPRLLLRIPEQRFDFAATGIPTFPRRRESLIALSATTAARATKAHLGPGLKWIESAGQPREHRARSQAVYAGFLRWRLTCLALVQANQSSDASHAPTPAQ